MKLTIFTPTYNRCELLKRIYDSIHKSQIYDLEWMVVDDGSVDKTEETVRELAKNAPFSIRYIKKRNGGKPSCYNVALEEAKGEWFVCIDDDDYFSNDGIQNLFQMFDQVNANNELSGFAGRVIDKNGNLLGRGPKKESLIASTIEMRDVYKIWGEPEIYKTEIIQNYRFPIYDHENFVTEAILFDEITCKKKLLFTNLPIMVKEYLIGGLTDRQLEIRLKNPNGTLQYYKQRIKLSETWKGKLRSLANYKRFLLHFHQKDKIRCGIVLSGASAILAKILYKRDLKII